MNDMLMFGFLVLCSWQGSFSRVSRHQMSKLPLKVKTLKN
jgi:hypothetical protein